MTVPGPDHKEALSGKAVSLTTGRMSHSGGGRADFPKLLILTNVLPGDFGVGSIYLRDLLAEYPGDKVSFLSVDQIPDQETKARWSCSYVRLMRADLAIDPLTFGVYEAIVSSADRLGIMSPVFRQIKDIADREKPDVLVAVLFDNWIVRNAAAVQKELNLPLVSIVWDPPGYLAQIRKRTGIGKSMLIRAFKRALERSSGICFPSHTMRASFPELKEIPSEVAIHSVEEDVFKDPLRAEVREGASFRIAFSGSMYARENWSCLFSALDILEWRLSGKPVELICMGIYLAFDGFTGPVNLRVLGYRSIPEQLDEIAASEICYLPYWFRPEHRETAQYSFPNKLSIYLAAGRPVLFHGPLYSSIPSTDHLSGIGPNCFSLDPGELASCLRDFALSTGASYRSRILELREREFKAQVFRDRFHGLVRNALDHPRDVQHDPAE
jgi:hypothetical protein